MKVRNNLRLLPDRVIKDAVHDRRILYSYGAKTFGFDPILEGFRVNSWATMMKLRCSQVNQSRRAGQSLLMPSVAKIPSSVNA